MPSLTTWFILIISVTVLSVFAYNANNVIANMIARSELAACIETEGYVERWNPTDLRIRNEYYGPNTQKIDANANAEAVELMAAYVASVRVPNRSEQARLDHMVSTIDLAIFLNMKWIFLLFDDTKFEGGMPHTHGPFIMLPMNSMQSMHSMHLNNISTTTLLHEQIHVFQRYHPLTALKMLKEHTITGFVYPKNNHRANPDTSRILFDDIRPTWITDATHLNHIDDKRDHPFEIMAYTLQQ